MFRRSSETAPRGAMIARSTRLSRERRLERVASPRGRGEPLAARAGSGSSGTRPTMLAFSPGASLEPARDPARRLGVAEQQAALLGRSRASDVRGERREIAEHAREQQRPDPDRLVAAKAALDDQVPAEEDQQRVEGRDPEQRRDLVESRLVQQVLVAVVEAGELADEQDQRKRQQRNRVERIVADHRDAEQRPRPLLRRRPRAPARGGTWCRAGRRPWAPRVSEILSTAGWSLVDGRAKGRRIRMTRARSLPGAGRSVGSRS